MGCKENAIIVLSRFLGEYEPADESNATYRKSSLEIVMDMEEIVTLTVDDVTAEMIKAGFKLNFDDDTPVWLMKKRATGKAITE